MARLRMASSHDIAAQERDLLSITESVVKGQSWRKCDDSPIFPQSQARLGIDGIHSEDP